MTKPTDYSSVVFYFLAFLPFPCNIRNGNSAYKEHLLKTFFSVILGMALVCAPMAADMIRKAFGGTSTELQSLGIYGRDAVFTCDYVAPSGDQALLTSAGGHRRLVDISKSSKIQPGKHYKLFQRQLTRWGGFQAWLVEV